VQRVFIREHQGYGGHHNRCECGARHNCGIKPHEYCDIDEYKCRKCCIKSEHRKIKCIECNYAFTVTCKGDYINYFDEFVCHENKCEECKKCEHCNTPFFMTGYCYEYYSGACKDCYDENVIHIKCARRKCKKYITINLLDGDNPDIIRFCDDPICKKQHVTHTKCERRKCKNITVNINDSDIEHLCRLCRDQAPSTLSQ